MALSGLGRIEYNGFVFVGPMISSNLTAKPVRDETGRYVIDVEYTLTVSGYMTGDSMDGVAGYDGVIDTTKPKARIERTIQGGSTDNPASSRTMLNRLTEDGGTLHYTDNGFGDIIINNSDSTRDVAWGPHVQQCNFERVGGSDAVLSFEWVVTFRRPECYDGTNSNGVGVNEISNIHQFVFDVAHEYNDRGFMTRTVSGFVELSANTKPPTVGHWKSPRKVIFNPDKVRPYINPTVPAQCKRQRASFPVDSSKSRLDFTIVDVEMPSGYAFPEGIHDVQITHSAGSSWKESTHAKIRINLSIEIQYSKFLPSEADAMFRSVAIIRRRLRQIHLNARANKSHAKVLSISFEERPYEHSASAQFAIVVTKTPGEGEDGAEPKVFDRNWGLNAGLFTGLQRSISDTTSMADPSSWSKWSKQHATREWALFGGLDQRSGWKDHMTGVCDSELPSLPNTDKGTQVRHANPPGDMSNKP